MFDFQAFRKIKVEEFYSFQTQFETTSITHNQDELLQAKLAFYSASEYSRISPGWQSKASQMASNVENLIALAFPVLRMERLAVVIPTFSASSLLFISRLASIMSKLIKIAMLKW